MNTKTVNTAEIIPSGIIREACITLISKEDGGGLRGGTQTIVGHFVTNGMSTWEITPTNMPPGSESLSETFALMSLLSELMDIGNIQNSTEVR